MFNFRKHNLRVQHFFLAIIFIVTGIFVVANSSEAIGLTVGNSSLNLQAAENLFYGKLSSENTIGNFLLFQQGSNNIFKVDALGGGYFAGNVGVGTTAPTQKLEVNGKIAANAYYFNSSTKYSTELASSLYTDQKQFIVFNNLFAAGESLYSGTIKIVARKRDNNSSPNGILEKTFVFNVSNGVVGSLESNVDNALNGMSYVRIGEPFIDTDMYLKIPVNSTNMGSGRGVYFEITVEGPSAWVSKFSNISFSSSTADTFPGYSYPTISSRLGIGLGNNVMPSQALQVTGSALFSGNVGIGTTAPGKLLEVNGQAKFNSFAYGSTPLSTDTLAITTVEYVNAKTGGSGGVGSGTSGQTLRHNGTGWIADSTLFNNGTNVGIGTTAPGAKLDVENLSVGINEGLRLSHANAYDAGSKISWWMDNALESANITSAWYPTSVSKSYMAFSTYGPSLLERMRINGDGSVGIGTTTPDKKLDIATSVNTDGIRITGSSANASLIIKNNGTGGNAWDISSTGAGHSYGNGKLIFGIGFSPKVTFDGSGNVGIGTTAPGKLLEVNGQAKFNSFAYGSTPLSTDTLAITTVEYVNAKTGGSGGVGSGTSGQTLRHNGTGWIADSTLFNNGTNVGIGTTAPGAKLDVAGDAIFNTNTGSSLFHITRTGELTQSLDFYVDDSSAVISSVQDENDAPGSIAGRAGIVFRIGNQANQNPSFVVSDYRLGSDAELFRINQTGSVGIGTTAPSSKIHVSQTTAGTGVITGMFENLDYTATNRSAIRVRQQAGVGTGYSAYLGVDMDSHNIFLSNDSITANHFVINTSGNVGIGTTAPGGKLDVSQGMSDYGQSFVGSHIKLRTTNQIDITGFVGITYDSSMTANYGWSSGALRSINGQSSFIWKNHNSSAVGTEYMRIANNGNVGIGTTAPGKLLEVNGQAKFNSFAYGSTPLSTDTLAITTVEYVNAKTGGSGGVGSGTSGQTLRHNGTGWIADSTLFNNGTNVGIGTTGPSQKLEVVGNTLLNGSYLYLGNNHRISNGVSDLYIATASTDNNIHFRPDGEGATGGEVIFSGTGIHNFKNSAGISQMYLNNGNVGIGTTSPSVLLHVSGNSSQFARIEAITAGQNAGLQLKNDARMWQIYTDGADTGDQLTFRDSTQSLTRMVIDENGNVGIGTTAPARKLTVNGGTGSGDWLSMQYSGTETFSLVDDATNIVFATPDLSIDRGFAFNTYGGEKVRITSSGNVGIGTTAPGKLLEVDGQAKFNNFAYGSTPLSTDTLALATVEYVNTRVGSGNYLPLTGGTMSSASADINMNQADIINVNKLQVNTIDPLYNIRGVNYSTFAASIAGGVKEEYVGKININKKTANKEYEAVIDFAKVKEGSDLWVWRQVVDFNKDSVEVLATPYGNLAQVYYIIDSNKLTFRSDNPVEVSYRLIAKRFDWRQWPTLAPEQDGGGLKVTY